MAKYDVILMDADETLFDFVRSSQEALSGTLSHYGISVDEAVWKIYRRHNDTVWEAFERGEMTPEERNTARFERLFQELGIPADVTAANREYMEALGKEGYALPGAEDLCRALFPHRPLYIVTNGVLKSQASRMARSPLRPYIKKMYVSEQVGFRKPQKEFFDAVLSDIGIADRSRVILLGDSLTSDMAGGQNAAVDTCWYNPEGKDPGGLCPDYEIRALNEFIPIALS